MKTVFLAWFHEFLMTWLREFLLKWLHSAEFRPPVKETPVVLESDEPARPEGFESEPVLDKNGVWMYTKK